MSFKAFIYYCALLGGWGAFITWAFVQGAGIRDVSNLLMRATLIGGFLGMFVAGGIGLVDALLNAVGFQRVMRVGVCMGLGFFAGMFGGGVGQLLKTNLGFPLFIGWLLAGVLIGASIGVFDVAGALMSGKDAGSSFKKVLNGIYGGFLGGFLGGLPFTALIDNPNLPRGGLAMSLVLLGICIGLFIGLAQVILKEAWVKIEEGMRAGRELMLTKDETTIGRAETCDLGLFGDNAIQKLHACIIHKNNRYLLAHSAEDGETYLNDEEVGGKPMPLRDGDRIRLGRCVLRFGERAKRK